MTCFRDISGCPWPYLAVNKGVRNIDWGACIVAAGISIRDTCIGSTYAMATWIGCIDIESAYTKGIYAKSTFVGDVEPKALTKLKVILAGWRINDCCFWLLSYEIDFALTKGVYYWSRWEYWSLRSIHTFNIRYINL